DNWVVDELGVPPSYSINFFLPCPGTLLWLVFDFLYFTLHDQMMKELHSKGTRIEDIAANVSDANTFFIETILEHHGLKECFLEINTNPGFVDQQSRLRIFPHHDFTKSSWMSASQLPSKYVQGTHIGIVIERIQASLSMEDPKKTKIYLGDGLGDFCPSLKLGDGDYVMPRKDV
ncbi:hypothetical protein Golax_007788, partial [Gossypium laxum]|nr:hypothetical protein [Gossypium laxum]